MIDPSKTVRGTAAAISTAPAESISTFEWHGLHLHVATPEPIPADQLRTIERALTKVKSVGEFADVLVKVLGRHVRIRTERPSADVRLEVAR